MQAAVQVNMVGIHHAVVNKRFETAMFSERFSERLPFFIGNNYLEKNLNTSCFLLRKEILCI